MQYECMVHTDCILKSTTYGVLYSVLNCEVWPPLASPTEKMMPRPKEKISLACACLLLHDVSEEVYKYLTSFAVMLLLIHSEINSNVSAVTGGSGFSL
jgi:hypothetical protein